MLVINIGLKGRNAFRKFSYGRVLKKHTLKEIATYYIITWKHFNFNFKCNFCISYKNRREVALNELFDEDTTKNILSYTTCYHCHKMHEYEKEYDYENKLILPNYQRVEHRQIHCILNRFDNGYKKLTNLKDKKNCLKDMTDKSKSPLAPLLKKFVNDPENIKMMDEYRMFWLLDYNIFFFMKNGILRL